MLEKLGTGIVSVTVGLILFLGLFIYASVMNSNPYKAMAAAPAIEAAESRLPASVVNLSAEVERVVLTPAQKEAEVISLACFNGSTPVTVASHAKQIRLRGPLCGGKEVSNLEVINRTNGFVATIFQTEKTRYSSDYIHLAKGDNQILLSYTDASGNQRAAELTISRAPGR